MLLQWGLGSTYTWRRVIPYLADLGKVIAVDLPGTGASQRVVGSTPTTYTIEFQRSSLETLLLLLGIDHNVTLVLHGPASMVGFDWAARHPASVRAIAHMESITRPTIWPDFDDPFRTIFKRLRFGDIEKNVVNSETYLEDALRRETVYPPDSQTLEAYAENFQRGADARRSYLASYQQIPVAGQPEAARLVVGEYAEWLERSPVPKLLILGQPGFMLAGRMRSAAERLPNQTVVEVIGRHLLPEDAPDGVGNLIAMWMRGLPPV